MTHEFKSDLLIDVPVSTECRTSVVIPVRDEARYLPATLAAFAGQRNLRGGALDPRSFELIILANNCTDSSATIIEKFRRENLQMRIHLAEITLSAENSNIGFVRRRLMDEAFFRLTEHREDGVILTTDGDTSVALDWIAANLREIENGADAVGGRINITPKELAAMDANCREFYLKDEEYRLLTAEIEALIDNLPHDSAPRHHQHFNGSFAVTTKAYEKAGGVPHVEFLEDVAFYEALQRVDAKFRHSPSVKAYTSSRHEGRSAVGLSYQFNEWRKLGECDADFLVESAQTIEERLRTKRILRDFWRRTKSSDFPTNAEIYDLSARFRVGAKFLTDELNASQTFGVLYEKVLGEREISGELKNWHSPVPLDAALQDLREIISLIKSGKSNFHSFSQTSSR